MAAAFAMLTTASVQVLAKVQFLNSTTLQARVLSKSVKAHAHAHKFKALLIEVWDSDAELEDVKVIYTSGTSEDIPLHKVVKAKSMIGPIALKGASRVIDEIVVNYVPSGAAQIVFSGVEAAVPPVSPDGWGQLGCKFVSYQTDHDVIEVGRKQDLYSALRLRVGLTPLAIKEVQVTFGDGTQGKLSIGKQLHLDPDTKPRGFDLEGGHRGIERIDLHYVPLPDFHLKAEVCVDGLQR